MVTQTSRYDIPCLDDTDPAAVALYMKCLAEQIEGELLDRQQQVTAMLERPASIWTASDTLGGGTIARSSANADAQTTALRWPTQDSATTLGLANLRGWWHVGMNVHVQATGGVTANQYRAAWFGILNPNATDTSDVENYAVYFENAAWESSTGNGEDMHASGVVFNPGNPALTGDQIGMRARYFLSLPTGAPPSTINFDSTFWAVFLGDLPEIEVTA